MASLICAHALSILLVGGLRFGHDLVLPGSGRGTWLAVVIVVTAGLALSVTLESRRGMAPWRSRGRLLLWLVFPGAAALSWSLGGSSLETSRDLPALGVVLAIVLAVLVVRRREWAFREQSAASWRASARWLVAPTAAGCAAAALHPGPMAPGLGIALATYPVYAAAQLAAGLVLPWTQWDRDHIGPGRRILAATVLFGLVHWPNGFAVGATLAGMLVWAAAWRARATFSAIALSMGLLAAFVTQGLPDSLHAHMRVGAAWCVDTRAIELDRRLDEEAMRLDAIGRWSSGEGLRPWLARVLEATAGGTADAALVEETAQTLERMHRQWTLRWIFDAGEFRARHRVAEAMTDEDLLFFGSGFVPWHPAHAGYEEVIAQGAGMTTPRFIDLAYRRFLGRTPLESEYRHWPEPLTAGQRRLFLRRIVEAGSLRGWNAPAGTPVSEGRPATPR